MKATIPGGIIHKKEEGMEKRVLGKGLSALIPEQIRPENEEGVDGQAEVLFLKTALIRDNSRQPRTKYEQSKIEELKASIREKGILQPLLIRKKDRDYEVIAGERRLKAARALGLEKVPVIIRNVSDDEAFVLALVENIQREELTAIEEAQAFRRLIDDFHFSQEEIAASVGKDRSTISNTLRLLRLPEDIQQSVLDGELSKGHARALVGVERAGLQRELFERVLDKGLSVRELENLIKAGKRPSSADKPSREKSRGHELVFLEEELQQILGTKVRIQAGRKRGKVLIEYYSLDDLERILKLVRTVGDK